MAKRNGKSKSPIDEAVISEAIEANRFLGHMRDDDWSNVVSGLGRAATDKRVHAEPNAPRSAHDRTRYDNIYHGDPMAARIADLLPHDETREWIQLRIEEEKSDDSERTEDPTQAAKERTDIETAMMDRLEELNIQNAIFEARTWARVYGGSLMMLGAVDGATDLKEPLNEDRIVTFQHVNVFDRHEWTPHTFYADPNKANFGLPETYIMGERNVPGGIAAEGASADMIVHETRFIRFDGPMTSRRRRVTNNGWHDPIYVKLYAIIRDFAQSWGGVAAMLQDFRVSVWKMKGLVDALKAGEHDLVLDRFRIMELCKSIANAVPLDADNEDFETKTTNLTGLPDTLDRFAEQLSAATGYPVALLFGKSPAGLTATGDSDIRQYYDMVGASQRTHVLPPLNRIIELLFKSKDGPTQGAEPAWSIKFNELWQLDDLQESTRRENIAKADKIYIETGVLTKNEVAMSRHGGDEYNIDTTLDHKERAELEAEEAENGGVDKEREAMRFGAEMAAAAAANNGVPPDNTDPNEREDNIRRRGPRDWVVTSNEGKIIGRHTTRTGAESQIGHILESQGVIVERLSASEWIVVNAEGDIVGVHTTRGEAGSQVDEILGRADRNDTAFMHRERVAYYAHPMGTYGTEQEAEDIAAIKAQGYTVVNPGDPDHVGAYRLTDKLSMEPFLELVRGSDIVFKRGTTSGVIYEVHEAHKHGIPVTEL